VRQILSVRFFAAVGAVAALLFVLTSLFVARDAIDDAIADDDGDETPMLHAIDFVDRVEATSPVLISLDDDGLTVADIAVTIDATRAMRIAPGTPGEVLCQPTGPGVCAIVADLLGEAVVWFALVPMGGSTTTVQLPAIDTLEDGLATLVNGWQFRYASVLDRRCTDPQDNNEEDYESYREFRDVFGDNFVSVFDIPTQRLAAVVCRVRVPYAPVSGSTLPTGEPLPTLVPPGATTIPIGPPVTAPIITPPPQTLPPTLAPGSTVVNEG
jgi:hypothetical protein